MPELVTEPVEVILSQAVENFPHDDCLSCECFLGLVAQLGIAASPADRSLLAQYKIPRKEMHACLGCDPCPPGERYAKYIHSKQASKIITL
jgi:hypothetical protein